MISAYQGLEFDDDHELEYQMYRQDVYRQKIYDKFTADPLNKTRSILKLVRKSKTGKRVHVEGAKKIIDAMTAINNDS